MTPRSGGLRVWGAEEVNLADTDQALPLPTGASPPAPRPSSSFRECPLNNDRCLCQTTPFENIAANIRRGGDTL